MQASLTVPVIDLSIQSNRGTLNNCEETSSSGGSHQIQAEYNYSKNGKDWAEKWPSCGAEQQSPINFLNPVTEYGNSYFLFDFGDDELIPEYWDMAETLVEYKPEVYTIEVMIDHSNGYNGFVSEFADILFEAPTKWDGFKF